MTSVVMISGGVNNDKCCVIDCALACCRMKIPEDTF